MALLVAVFLTVQHLVHGERIGLNEAAFLKDLRLSRMQTGPKTPEKLFGLSSCPCDSGFTHLKMC